MNKPSLLIWFGVGLAVIAFISIILNGLWNTYSIVLILAAVVLLAKDILKINFGAWYKKKIFYETVR